MISRSMMMTIDRVSSFSFSFLFSDQRGGDEGIEKGGRAEALTGGFKIHAAFFAVWHLASICLRHVILWLVVRQFMQPGLVLFVRGEDECVYLVSKEKMIAVYVMSVHHTPGDADAWCDVVYAATLGCFSNMTSLHVPSIILICFMW